MSLTIKLPSPKNLSALFLKAKSDAEKHNITWAGDTKQGHGKGFGFEGSYTVDTDCITISVLMKPPFLSKARIEKEVMKYLSHDCVIE